MEILLLHGANLNMLGRRNKDVYGDLSYEQLVDSVSQYARQLGHTVKAKHSNVEGELINILQQHIDSVDAVVINAGAYSHYSYALRDCIEYMPMKVASVHLSDIDSREDWRHNDLLSDVCCCTISGKGLEGYYQAIRCVTSCE